MSFTNNEQSGPLSAEDAFHGPLWMPETMGSTVLYIYYVFFFTYIPMMKFNL